MPEGLRSFLDLWNGFCHSINPKINNPLETKGVRGIQNQFLSYL
jgi:hypothetical protein